MTVATMRGVSPDDVVQALAVAEFLNSHGITAMGPWQTETADGRLLYYCSDVIVCRKGYRDIQFDIARGNAELVVGHTDNIGTTFNLAHPSSLESLLDYVRRGVAWEQYERL